MSTQTIEKAYENLGFLRSPSARPIRVLCEMLEAEQRFRNHAINNTIAFFGSTYIPSKEHALAVYEENKAAVNPDPDKLDQAATRLKMSDYYEDARALSFRLTQWAMEIDDPQKRFWVCSGGGSGIMEAANRGAKEAGGYSIGMNISLPQVQMGNAYQDAEVSFLFHYFFVRKFWFAYLAKALIVFPGGFGTLDELFEMLTLVQTGKLKKCMPIVIYGSRYWKQVLSFKTLVEHCTISQSEMNLFRMIDSVEEAFDYLKTELTKNYLLSTKGQKGTQLL